MLNDKAVIGQIGVPEVNEDLLVSIFGLAPALNDIYLSQPAEADQLADVIFINADDRNAILQWHEQSKQKTNIPIMVTSGNKQIGKVLTIQAPINFRKIMLALKMVSSTANPAAGRTQVKDTGLSVKVLVVDDSLPVRKFMENKLPTLLPNALRVDFAASGEEAGKKINSATNPYDVVFLDVVMPGVDGYKVCKWIKANHPCRVVMLTSKSSPFDKVRGAMSGCDDYLTKPPDEKRLQKVLYKVLKIVQKNAKSQDSTNEQIAGTG